MTDKELPGLDLDEEESISPRLAALKRRREKQNDGVDYPKQLREAKTETETIDLNDLAEETSQVQRSFNPQNIPGSKFGLLLDALPVPAMLIDVSGTIVFSNQACSRVAGGEDKVRVAPFGDLFHDPSGAEKAMVLVNDVFDDRKTRITEAMLQFGDNRLWGRIHLRMLRMGNFSSVLVLVEDQTHVKRELHLNRLDKADLERQLAERVEELKAGKKAVTNEIAKREAAEKKLKSVLEFLGNAVSILKDERDSGAQADEIRKLAALLKGRGK